MARTSGRVNRQAAERVLAGRARYDDLSDEQQAAVRQEWNLRISAAREDLDFASEFAAAGETYSEADANGDIVIHHAGVLKPES